MRLLSIFAPSVLGLLSVACGPQPEDCAADRRVVVGIEEPEFLELADGDELRVFVPPQSGAASVVALRITCSKDGDSATDLSLEVRTLDGQVLSEVKHDEFPAYEFGDALHVPHVMVYYGDALLPEDLAGDAEIDVSLRVGGEVVSGGSTAVVLVPPS